MLLSATVALLLLLSFGGRRVYGRVKDEAGQQLADLVMSPPGRKVSSPWLGVWRTIRDGVADRWQVAPFPQCKTHYFSSKEGAAAFRFVHCLPHEYHRLMQLRTTYEPLVRMRRQVQRLLIGPYACCRTPLQRQPSSIGCGPSMLAALWDARGPVSALKAARTRRRPLQYRNDEDRVMGRLGNFCMRAMEGLATTSVKQLLALERLLPVPRHGLYGLTATQASQLMQEQANTVGLLHWREGHFDRVWPFALLPHLYHLFLACSSLNLRVLPAAVNMQRGSGGVSLVQSRWGTPLWGQLRRLPNGELLDLETSRQPLEMQERADEVEQQQSWHLWSIACACLRDAIGVQLWQIGRHLRHGGTGLPEVSVPLLPPTDGSGAGLDKQLAGRIAHRAVGLYLDRAATDRAHAGLPQLPSELTSDVQRRLQHRLYELLVAPPAGPQEQEEEEQAEEEREVAWAAEVDGEAVQEQAQRQQQTRRQLVEEARRRLLEEARQQMGARRLATGHLPVLEQIRLQEEAWEQVLEQRRLEEACHVQKQRKLSH